MQKVLISFVLGIGVVCGEAALADEKGVAAKTAVEEDEQLFGSGKYAEALTREKEVAAKAAFDEGKQLFASGKYAKASAAFRRANELRPNWKLLYNIGQSEAAAKNHGLAMEAFESYLSQSGDEITEERRQIVISEIARLKPIVGYIEFEVPDGAVVFVDSVDRGKAPLAGPVIVSAGVTHEIVVSLNGKELYHQDVRVVGDRTKTVVAKAEAKAEAEAEAKAAPPPAANERSASPRPAPQTKKGTALKTAGWVTAGVGGVLLVAGVIAGGVALSKDKALEKKCDGGVCSGEDWQEAEKMKKLGIAADVLFGVGAAAAATGVVLVVVAALKGKRESDTALAPLVGSDFAGAAFCGRF